MVADAVQITMPGVVPELLIEVARCICSGFTISETARALAISKKAVEKHRNEIYRSLNVRNAEGLFRAAAHWCLPPNFRSVPSQGYVIYGGG
jgi:DNA-binding NarL/FixJ family response regulator